MKKITESTSEYSNLDEMTTLDLLEGINSEDQKVAIAVKNVIPEITKFVDQVVQKMKAVVAYFILALGQADV